MRKNIICFIMFLFCFSLFSQGTFFQSSSIDNKQTISETKKKDELKEEKEKNEEKEEKIEVPSLSMYYQYYSLSSIEEAFNDSKKIPEYQNMLKAIFGNKVDINTPVFQRLDEFPILRQFGYKVFLTSPTSFIPLKNIPVGPDYILGPEDELIIDVWGMLEGNFQVTIDREGGITLPKIGRIYLSGLTFSDAERVIRQQFDKYFKDFQLSIYMGKLRTIKVFVLGDVNRPGGYELPSLATLFTALYASGGPTKIGSLREIKLIRNNEIIEIADFYKFLIYGDKSQDIRLFSGDVIFIPTIGDTVAISGNIVKRPGIYEIKENISLKELIDLSGKISPFGFDNEITIESLKEKKEIKKYNFNSISDIENIKLEGGTIVRIFAKTFPKKDSPMTVELKGEIEVPGKYTIEKGEKLSSVLKRAGGFTDEAFLKGTVFTRNSVKKIQQEYIERFIKSQQESLLREVGFVSGMRSENLSGIGELIQQQKELISLITSYVPLGRVPIKLDKIEKFEGSENDILLEDGDTLYVPKTPVTVQVIGAVKNPSAILFTHGKSIDYYIEKTGGYTKNANLKEIFIIKADGTSLTKFTRIKDVELGDAIIIPEEIKMSRWQLLKDICNIFYQLAMPAAVFSNSD